jgi:aspartate aminotransferase
MKVATRMALIHPSATLEATARAASMRAQGIDVVSFAAGEPDFDTPAHIKDAAKAALDKGQTKYTAIAGTPDLRKAVAGELNAAHGLKLGPENIIVSTGAKHSLFNLFHAILDDGDEVLIPAPYWVSYPDLVRLAGGVPRPVATRAEDGFLPTLDELREATTPRTRAIVLNSPSNPTGAVVPHRLLEEIAAHALSHDLVVVSDDIYRQLIYGAEPFTEIATLGPEIAARTLIVDGLSKSYAMTGWRIGFCAAPVEIVTAMTVLQGQSTSNPTSIAQAAALAALTGPQDSIGVMRQEFDRRRRTMVEALRAIPGVVLSEPLGAFYAFPSFKAYLGRRTPAGALVSTDAELAQYLLDAAHVACIPGEAFGGPGHLRLSYATAYDRVVEGVKRIRGALEAMR